MKDLTPAVTILCMLIMSVFLICLSIVWAVDIKGTVANDNIIGTAADDDIRGFRGNDILNGLSGSDEIQGEGGNDLLNGSDGNEQVVSQHRNKLGCPAIERQNNASVKNHAQAKETAVQREFTARICDRVSVNELFLPTPWEAYLPGDSSDRLSGASSSPPQKVSF